MNIDVQTEVPESSQESSFMNATLQSASETHSINIAVHLPSGAAEKEGVNLDDAISVQDWMHRIFQSALEYGCEISVQVGPAEK